MTRRFLLGPADLEENEMRGYEPEGSGRLVCLVHTGGRYLAIDDWCNHAGCQLSMGGWVDATAGRCLLVCPCHEIGFDAATGRNVTSPQIAGDQSSFEVEVEGGQVFVRLPEEGS